MYRVLTLRQTGGSRRSVVFQLQNPYRTLLQYRLNEIIWEELD